MINGSCGIVVGYQDRDPIFDRKYGITILDKHPVATMDWSLPRCVGGDIGCRGETIVLKEVAIWEDLPNAANGVVSNNIPICVLASLSCCVKLLVSFDVSIVHVLLPPGLGE